MAREWAVKRDSDSISGEIPPQMKILNMVIPILMHFCSFVSNLRVASPKNARHPMKCDIISDVKLFSTVYCRIYCRKFLTLYYQASRYKVKCIGMYYKGCPVKT